MAFLRSARPVGYLYALAAPLCWNIGGVIFRSVDADAWDAVFWRSLAHVVVFPLAAASWFAGAIADTRRAGPTAFVAALCIAGVLILHVLAMMKTAVANVLVLQSLSPLLVALPLANLFDTSPRDASLLFGLGVIQNTLGLGFYLLALRQLPAAQVALLALIEPVLGPLWTWLFVGEAPAALTLAGGSVVIAALVVNTMLGLRAQRQPGVLAA